MLEWLKVPFVLCWLLALVSWVVGVVCMFKMAGSKSGRPPLKAPPAFVSRYWLSNAYLFENEVPWRKRLLLAVACFLALGAVGGSMAILGATVQRGS
jgi:hypothetical protein